MTCQMTEQTVPLYMPSSVTLCREAQVSNYRSRMKPRCREYKTVIVQILALHFLQHLCIVASWKRMVTNYTDPSTFLKAIPIWACVLPGSAIPGPDPGSMPGTRTPLVFSSVAWMSLSCAIL